MSQLFEKAKTLQLYKRRRISHPGETAVESQTEECSGLKLDFSSVGDYNVKIYLSVYQDPLSQLEDPVAGK